MVYLGANELILSVLGVKQKAVITKPSPSYRDPLTELALRFIRVVAMGIERVIFGAIYGLFRGRRLFRRF